tara:strand:- start:294 stop:590 length:297 start_codon:yes stop_codon:yes gene_type:complete
MFSPNDFANEETNSKLSVIIMTMFGKPPMTNFHKLLEKEKKKFNGLLNEYIRNLPEKDWLDRINEEYNQICTDEIFTEEFNPKQFEPANINTEIQLIE